MSEKSLEEGYKKKPGFYSQIGAQHPSLIFENLIWLTTEEAAIYLRKSADAVRHLVYRGDLRARKFKRRLYFKRDELDKLLDLSVF
jgi:excisionase family DNA binding protein